MARIAVIGPGALGTLFSGLLALAGHDVGLVARRRDVAEQIARDGVIVERDGVQRRSAVWTSLAGDEVPAVEVILVLVKSFDTDGAAHAALPILAADGMVASLQNGLGNAERLAAVVGPERVLAGVTSQGATLLGVGHTRHAGFGPSYLTEVQGGAGARAQRLASMLSEAGIPTQAEQELGPLVWGKLVSNVAINPLSALTGRRNGQLLDSPETTSLFDEAVREAAAVAHALGIVFAFDDAVAHAHRIAEITRVNRSSMLQDVERRRPTEIDAISGAVIELGARLGVPTPTNSVLYRLIKGIESGYELE